jgi:hypothetical protein
MNYDQKRAETENLRDLDKVIGYMGASHNLDEAVRYAQNNRAPTKVQDALLKAAQSGATSQNIGVDISSGFGTFFSQMRNLGAADAIAPFAVGMPRYRGRFVLMSAVTAGTVGEGAGKPVRRLTYTTNEATPSKGAALVVATREALMESEIQRSIRQELQRSLAQWTDSVLLTACNANSSDSTTVSGTFQDFMDDLQELLQIVKGSAQSNLFLVTSPDVAKAVAAMAAVAGLNLDWKGFDLGGVRILPSDAQNSSSMTLIDASQVAMRLGEISLRTSEEGTVEMDGAPSGETTTPAQSTGVSLWQTNSVAYLCERSATIEAITPFACATLTNLVIGDTGGSPA